MNCLVIVCYVFGQRPLVWRVVNILPFCDLNVVCRGALGLVSM
jgi:hypothetical protein